MTLSATAPRPAGAEPTPAFCEGIQYFSAPWADADRHATAVIAPHQKAVADPADATAVYQTLLAADALNKYFPMLTTAAGMVFPAKVFVIGAAVAGLKR